MMVEREYFVCVFGVVVSYVECSWNSSNCCIGVGDGNLWLQIVVEEKFDVVWCLQELGLDWDWLLRDGVQGFCVVVMVGGSCGDVGCDQGCGCDLWGGWCCFSGFGSLCLGSGDLQ